MTTAEARTSFAYQLLAYDTTPPEDILIKDRESFNPLVGNQILTWIQDKYYSDLKSTNNSISAVWNRDQQNYYYTLDGLLNQLFVLFAFTGSKKEFFPGLFVNVCSLKTPKMYSQTKKRIPTEDVIITKKFQFPSFAFDHAFGLELEMLLSVIYRISVNINSNFMMTPLENMITSISSAIRMQEWAIINPQAFIDTNKIFNISESTQIAPFYAQSKILLDLLHSVVFTSNDADLIYSNTGGLSTGAHDIDVSVQIAIKNGAKFGPKIVMGNKPLLYIFSFDDLQGKTIKDNPLNYLYETKPIVIARERVGQMKLLLGETYNKITKISETYTSTADVEFWVEKDDLELLKQVGLNVDFVKRKREEEPLIDEPATKKTTVDHVVAFLKFVYPKLVDNEEAKQLCLTLYDTTSNDEKEIIFRKLTEIANGGDKMEVNSRLKTFTKITFGEDNELTEAEIKFNKYLAARYKWK